jgi:hypothetical protein
MESEIRDANNTFRGIHSCKGTGGPYVAVQRPDLELGVLIYKVDCESGNPQHIKMITNRKSRCAYTPSNHNRAMSVITIDSNSDHDVEQSVTEPETAEDFGPENQLGDPGWTYSDPASRGTSICKEKGEH